MPLYLIVGLGIGFLIPLHVSMNSRAGALGGSPAIANVAFWIVGLATSLAIAAGELSRGGLSRFGAVPAPLWLAGGIGAGISLAISVLIPKLGVANASFLMILGQMVASALMSDRGFLGPRDPISPQKLAGLAVMAAGLALFVFARPKAA